MRGLGYANNLGDINVGGDGSMIQGYSNSGTMTISNGTQGSFISGYTDGTSSVLIDTSSNGSQIFGYANNGQNRYGTKFKRIICHCTCRK